MRRSCTDCRYSVAPGMCEALPRRMRAITWSAVSLRPSSRKVMFIWPWLTPPAAALPAVMHDHHIRILADRHRRIASSSLLHRLERGLLIGQDGARQAAGVLLREEALGHDDVEINGQRDGAQRDAPDERLVAQHPGERPAYSPPGWRRTRAR